MIQETKEKLLQIPQTVEGIHRKQAYANKLDELTLDCSLTPRQHKMERENVNSPQAEFESASHINFLRPSLVV